MFRSNVLLGISLFTAYINSVRRPFERPPWKLSGSVIPKVFGSTVLQCPIIRPVRHITPIFRPLLIEVWLRNPCQRFLLRYDYLCTLVSMISPASFFYAVWRP